MLTQMLKNVHRLILAAFVCVLLSSAAPVFAQGGDVALNLHLGDVQSSRADAAMALLNVERCPIQIVMAADGTFNGTCGSPTGDNIHYVTVTGKVDLNSGSVSFTYDITFAKRYFDAALRGVWHLVYHGTGSLTNEKDDPSGATVASGTATFEYSCQSEEDASWCGRYGGEKSETFSGTTTWSGLIPAAKPRVPLIFVPGIAGSVLQVQGTAVNLEVWPLALVESRHKLGLERDGDTPAVPGTKIIASDILRSVGLVSKVYSPLIKNLESQGYKENTDLFVFPYDWRLDNTQQVLKLAGLVDKVREKTGAAKVNIVTHSMGGLIARAYVNSAGKDKVANLITISMPFYGSPVAYYALVNGYSFGNPFVRPELIKLLGQNWPAPYQISPRKPFIIDAATNEALPLQDAYQIRYVGFEGVSPNVTLPGILSDVYTPTLENAWTFNPELVQRANDFHALLVDKNTGQEKPLPDTVKHYAIIGDGVRTLSWYRMRDAQPGESFLEFGTRALVLEPQFLDGDGTVPLWGLEFQTATRKYYVSYSSKNESSEHTALTQNPKTYALVKNILDGTPPPQNDYLPPPLVNLNTFLYFFEGLNFTLHSDAHLSITDPTTGQRMGFNADGGIDQQIPTGSFLSIDGVEYASVADLVSTYQVSVTGTNDGKFHLSAQLAQNGVTTDFEYPEVTVKKGTLAQFTFKPSEMNLSALPSMQVTTDGETTNVNARVTNQTTFVSPTPAAAVTAAAPGSTLPAPTVNIPVATVLALPVPSTHVPVATQTGAPTATLLPSFPPGVYVTQIDTDPLEPKRHQNVTFAASFINTTGAPQQYKWLIQIYDAETSKRFGETLVVPLTVPSGTSVQVSPDNWQVTGDGACVSYYAQAQFQNADTGRIPFTAPEGSAYKKYFTVCP